MVLDHALVAAGDEDELLDARRARLVDDVLQDRPIDDGQHLLGDRLGRGQEARAEARDRQHRFANGSFHASETLLPICAQFGGAPPRKGKSGRESNA